MTTCYTFKVTMTVQVLSEEDADTARASLDQNGGFVSKRDVELLDSTHVPSHWDAPKEKTPLSVVKDDEE